MTTADVTTLDFLVRAAREFRRGGWVFTGFHWPVLAGQLAHYLSGEPFTQVFEAGATTHGPGRQVPTSTTDYTAYANSLGYVGDSASILLGLAPAFDRAILDASNIDVSGRVNSSIIGPRERPTVRLPGGGGAPDIAGRARELIWLSGGRDLKRIQARVEHVTAAPGLNTQVVLHTRWGTAALGTQPCLREVADVPGTQQFVDHLAGLGVDTSRPHQRASVSLEDRDRAERILTAAAERGYQVARQAFTTQPDARGER